MYLLVSLDGSRGRRRRQKDTYLNSRYRRDREIKRNFEKENHSKESLSSFFMFFFFSLPIFPFPSNLKSEIEEKKKDEEGRPFFMVSFVRWWSLTMRSPAAAFALAFALDDMAPLFLLFSSLLFSSLLFSSFFFSFCFLRFFSFFLQSNVCVFSHSV